MPKFKTTKGYLNSEATSPPHPPPHIRVSELRDVWDLQFPPNLMYVNTSLGAVSEHNSSFTGVQSGFQAGIILLTNYNNRLELDGTAGLVSMS